MNLKPIITGAIALLLCISASAQYDFVSQNQLDSIRQARMDAINKARPSVNIPGFEKKPVKSILEAGAEPMDTLDTPNQFIKILLYPDYTWKYFKDPSFIMGQDVFTSYWTDEYPDPYRVSLSDLPERISIWVVDTLSAYYCPNQVDVYSPFGYRHRRRHMGVDLPLKKGDPVYAAFAGKVRMSKYYHGYGNLVVLRHENGLETFYAHLSRRDVEVGDWVEAGEVLGLGGATGRATGAHLHFETRYKGYAFDPQWLIDFKSGKLRHRLFTLKKKYLSVNSKYVPESDTEEEDINEGDTKDKELAAKKAAEDQKKMEQAMSELAEAQYHTIRSGDSLGSLAVKYHTTVSKICRLNEGLTTRTILRIGRRIRVK